VTRLPPELRDDLSPLPDEIEGLVQPLPAHWSGRLVQDSQPQPVELARLRARLAAEPRRAPRPTRSRRALVAVIVLIAAIGGWHAFEPSASDPEGPALVSLGGPAQVLGPTISVEGQGRLSVTRGDLHHQRVQLLAGGATFRVDPSGPPTRLVVQAGDVEVEVRGTVFTVELRSPSVVVRVHRGQVEVRHGGEAELLGQGQRWRRPAEPVAPAPSIAVPDPEQVPEERVVDLAPAPERPAPIEPIQPEEVLAMAPAEAVEQVPSERSLAAAEAYVDILELLELEASPRTLLAATAGFLHDHSGSAMASEVAAIQLEARAELEPSQPILAELDRWLADNPEGAWRLRLLAARARLAHQGLGDCVLALPSYSDLLREGGEAWRVWAREGIEACRGED